MPLAHLGSVLEITAELGARFNHASKRLYLVGGIVRDQWLDMPADASSDIDLTTNARPDAIKDIVEGWADTIWTQGEKFGTIGLRAAGCDFEITTHRAESYTSESRKPVVSFGDHVDVDLSRRDFTINAMAIELPAGELVDPYGGAGDLEAGVLRTPLSADISFSDDPLRMLRAARFATRFSMTIDPTILIAATALHQRVRIVAIERIGNELERLLALDGCGQGLRFLAETGVLSEVLAYGHPDLLADTTLRAADGIAWVEALDAEWAAASRGDWRLRMAALLAGTYGSTEAVQQGCERLRLSRDDERHIVDIVRGMRSIPAGSVSDMRRWAAAVRDRESAMVLAQAAHPADTEQLHAVQSHQARYRELAAAEDLSHVGPELDGAAIMELLDVQAGPVVGQAVTVLREYRYDHGPVSADVETEVLRQWWADNQSS